MALDLQKDFERLSTKSKHPPDEHKIIHEHRFDGEASNYEYERKRWETKYEEAVEDEKEIPTQFARAKPSIEAFDDTPTPPIDVPNPLGDHGERRHYASRLQDSYGYDEASLSDNISSKRTSLSFDPLVKLDSGDKIALEAPVPKLPSINTGRGRSLLEEVHRLREKERRDLSRPRSETDREEYDPESGERIDLGQRRRDTRYVKSQPRWPFLQATVDELAAEKPGRNSLEGSQSLTSRTTASPLSEEVKTPDSAPFGDHLISPISIPSPESRPDWASPTASPKRPSSSARSRSYGVERKSRRGNLRRSAPSMSPASAFLNRYMPVSPLPDPDAEGQEVGDYVMGREIGFGGFSIIREAYTFQGDTKIQRAVKIVRRQVYGKEETENESLQAEFEHEVSLWRYLHHKHILPLIAVYISDFATFAFMQNNTGGTLFDAVRANRSGLPANRVKRYAYQLASALRYLHEDMRIVHRDVKLENCLLDTSGPTAEEDGGNVLLCDFGLADYVTGPSNPSSSNSSSGSSNPDHRSQRNGQGCLGAGNDPRDPKSPHHTFGPSDASTNLAGSLPYAAPELLETGRGILDPCVDVWACGVVCYAMIAGRLPFTHSFAPRVRVMILGGEWDRTKLTDKEHGADGAETDGVVGEWEGISDLVETCLERDPKYRPDIRWVLEHEWLESERDDGEEGGYWAS